MAEEELTDSNESITEVLTQEVELALKNIKNGKAAGRMRETNKHSPCRSM